MLNYFEISNTKNALRDILLVFLLKKKNLLFKICLMIFDDLLLNISFNIFFFEILHISIKVFKHFI